MEKKIITFTNTTKMNKNWQYCIGTGRLGLALQKEYLDHLKLVKEKINFQYIRGHGLLSDDIGIYREMVIDGKSEPFYNFTYIDRIFDSFLEMGIRPFIEFGFMPDLLASGDQTVFYWKGNVTPPKDYEKWENLIYAVVSHFTERYGIDEVLTWPFEVWNEPNLTNFWENADKDEYFKLYESTALAVKKVHPDLQVGGPAICGGADEWITDFLLFCKEKEVPVDFVSRHAYTSHPPHKVTPDYYYQELAENTDMLDQFKAVRNRIKESPFPDLPFHITEYNTSYSPINPVHDTAFNAAYLARILSEGGDYVDSFSYWTFSDVFEEADVPKSQFHGGFGLIALNEIPKPTFHLFHFFNQLGEELVFRDEHVIVTKKRNGGLAIVAWNLYNEIEGNGKRTLSLEMQLDFSDVFIKRQRVHEEKANPWKTWKELGRPRFPDKKMIQTLREASVPELITSRVNKTKSHLELGVELLKNEVTLIELQPVKDETAAYPELDDRLITSNSKM
ncbi:GH39 family glycosyl hydrolase [Jeotgalibacillus proteolyticus]|uniref:GH39 family glycosyl hydrolase n=1 Tax=Jeotgalibacillus proteolyticus TaxID=2082395 RepID=UPI003CF3C0AA